VPIGSTCDVETNASDEWGVLALSSATASANDGAEIAINPPKTAATESRHRVFRPLDCPPSYSCLATTPPSSANRICGKIAAFEDGRYQDKSGALTLP
jgi:hypothetical protein